MEIYSPTDIITILGRRGTGKSYLCRAIQNNFNRLIVFDTMKEYNTENFYVINSFESYANFIYNNFRDENFRLIIQLNIEETNKQLIYNEMLRIAYYMGKVCIVTEEIQHYSNCYWLPHFLKECLLTGRHQNIAMIFTSQRVGEVNKTILSQSNHIYSGQIHALNDINYLKSFIGDKAKNDLPNLAERKFLYFSPNKTTTIINNDLSVKVIDSNAESV